LEVGLAEKVRHFSGRDSFKFKKRCELFVGVHNKTPSVVAVRVNNPDRSPVGINR